MGFNSAFKGLTTVLPRAALCRSDIYLSETNTDFRGQIFAGSEYNIYLSLKEMRVE